MHEAYRARGLKQYLCPICGRYGTRILTKDGGMTFVHHPKNQTKCHVPPKEG